MWFLTTATTIVFWNKMAAFGVLVASLFRSQKPIIFTARQFQMSCQNATRPKNKSALVRRTERRMRRKYYDVRRPTPKTAKVNVTNVITGINFAEDQEIAQLSEKLALTDLARSQIKQSSAIVDPGSVYQTEKALKPTVIGEDLKPRLLWEEKDWPNGFPESAEEADVDVTTYLVQKDIFRRRQVIEIPKFCVGSILAVTRAEPYSPKGSLRFVGLCIERIHPENLLYSNFTLRNVIDNEPIEITFQLYSPLIQKIEVLKHERRVNKFGKPDLTFLRDHPIDDSRIDENMEALPYTEEPTEYAPKPGDLRRWKRWYRIQFKKKNPTKERMER